jgi:hypothetical protein
MKRAMIGLILSVAVVSALVCGVEAAERRPLAEYFTNTG